MSSLALIFFFESAHRVAPVRRCALLEADPAALFACGTCRVKHSLYGHAVVEAGGVRQDRFAHREGGGNGLGQKERADAKGSLIGQLIDQRSVGNHHPHGLPFAAGNLVALHAPQLVLLVDLERTVGAIYLNRHAIAARCRRTHGDVAQAPLAKRSMIWA